MILQKESAKYGLIALFIIVLGITVLTTGCGKREAAKEEKQAVVGEKKENTEGSTKGNTKEKSPV